MSQCSRYLNPTPIFSFSRRRCNLRWTFFCNIGTSPDKKDDDGSETSTIVDADNDGDDSGPKNDETEPEIAERKLSQVEMESSRPAVTKNYLCTTYLIPIYFVLPSLPTYYLTTDLLSTYLIYQPTYYLPTYYLPTYYLPTYYLPTFLLSTCLT